jgi:hypothetical protein
MMPPHNRIYIYKKTNGFLGTSSAENGYSCRTRLSELPENMQIELDTAEGLCQSQLVHHQIVGQGDRAT